MKNLVAVLAFVMVSQAYAQNGYQGNEAVVVPVQTQQDVQAQPVQTQQAQPVNASGNPIYILNNQRQGTIQGSSQRQNAIQEQPVSVVQESPLKVSAADSMRKKRQESESATEDGIVQALERARMDDEIKRRDKFNNAIAPAANDATIVGNNNNVQQTNVVQQQQQVAQVVAPVPVAAPVKKINVIEDRDEDVALDSKVDIRTEIRAALEEQRRPEEKSSYYVAGLASFGNYDNVINVKRSMGWGFAVGTQLPERIIAEGSFLYGSYDLEDVYRGSMGPFGYTPFIVNMRQYNVSGAVKYALLPGKFRPVAGALLSYTRRSYSYGDYDFRTSDAIDAGALAGADLQLSSGFAIGLDFRYMTNLGYRQNTDRQQSFVYTQQRNDPEKLDYYSLNLMGKFTF